MHDITDEFSVDLNSSSKEEEIIFLEKKKRALLHHLKLLSSKMNVWIKTGVVSQMGETKTESGIKIPDSESRYIISTDPHLQQVVLKTFARFTLTREMLTNSVMPELEALQKEVEPTKIAN